MSTKNEILTLQECSNKAFELVNAYLVTIAHKLVMKAYNCLFIKDEKIHSVEGLLSSASAYIKSAKVVIDMVLPDSKNEGVRKVLQEIIEKLEAIENFKYEGSKFEKIIDKRGFEYKFFKVKHHARVLKNKIKELVR